MPGMTSLEDAVAILQRKLPDEVYSEVVKLIDPESCRSIQGSEIWPYDLHIAEILDQLAERVLNDGDFSEAVKLTDEIETGAFVAFSNSLQQADPGANETYLYRIAADSTNPTTKYNAVQLLVDNVEIPAHSWIKLTSGLESDSLAELFGEETVAFVKENLYSYHSEYEMTKQLEEICDAFDVNVAADRTTVN